MFLLFLRQAATGKVAVLRPGTAGFSSIQEKLPSINTSPTCIKLELQRLVDQLTDSKLLCSYFDNQIIVLVNFKEKMPILAASQM